MAAPEALAIIGAGASGTLCAVQAVRQSQSLREIILYDASGVFGPGLAYAPNHPVFILNVRAHKMGAFADDPAHFAHWLEREESLWRGLHPTFATMALGPDDFVPRLIYGAYLQALLSEACKSARIKMRAESVKYITPDGSSLTIMTEDSTQKVDAVILATGNSFARLCITGGGTLVNPSDAAFNDWDWQEVNHVVILGTGLSMVDTVQLLHTRGFMGRITAVSRHGLLPLPHAPSSPALAPVLDSGRYHGAMAHLVKDVRRLMKGTDWQSRIDSLRAPSQDFWLSLSAADKRRLGRALAYWSIARHRIPPQAHNLLQKLREEGRLVLHKGEVVAASENHITLRSGARITADSVVNCTGFSYAAAPLQALCRGFELSVRGGLCAPVAGSGFKLAPDHAVYGIGPVLHGHYFESTAIHEIRAHIPALLQEITREGR